jgi:hypothetical protein
MTRSATIKRHCYFPRNRPRVWWWKLLSEASEIIADGFSSKQEARDWAASHAVQIGGDA